MLQKNGEVNHDLTFQEWLKKENYEVEFDDKVDRVEYLKNNTREETQFLLEKFQNESNSPPKYLTKNINICHHTEKLYHVDPNEILELDLNKKDYFDWVFLSLRFNTDYQALLDEDKKIAPENLGKFFLVLFAHLNRRIFFENMSTSDVNQYYMKLKRTEKISIVKVNDIVEGGQGVCRHQSLLICYLLYWLAKESILPKGELFFDYDWVKGDYKNIGGHAWVIFRPRQTNDIWLIDHAQNILANLNLSSDRKEIKNHYGMRTYLNIKRNHCYRKAIFINSTTLSHHLNKLTLDELLKNPFSIDENNNIQLNFVSPVLARVFSSALLQNNIDYSIQNSLVSIINPEKLFRNKLFLYYTQQIILALQSCYQLEKKFYQNCNTQKNFICFDIRINGFFTKLICRFGHAHSLLINSIITQLSNKNNSVIWDDQSRSLVIDNLDATTMNKIESMIVSRELEQNYSLICRP